MYCGVVSTGDVGFYFSVDRSVQMFRDVSSLFIDQYQCCGMSVHCGTVSNNVVGFCVFFILQEK